MVQTETFDIAKRSLRLEMCNGIRGTFVNRCVGGKKRLNNPFNASEASFSQGAHIIFTNIK